MKSCAIYARISISSEESVSIERQVESARQYAASRNWTVKKVFVDDGVSATKNKPEDRKGWKDLLTSSENFESVVIWKVDRLARRVLDFLHADEDLQKRGASLVCVEDPIDMSSATGRAFAQMLAVFGELEAGMISARVTASRNHLLKIGRVPGGTVPYGWRSVPNPTGQGFVLAHDPDRIDWVRQMAERTVTGHTIYSTVNWLNESGAPLPTERGAQWGYTSVERLLRNPILAGMTRYRDDILRGDDGLPVVDDGIAIMPVAAWRAMIKALDSRDSSQTKPSALRAETSGAFSGLLWCGDPRHDEPVRMWRGTYQGRHGYYCNECHQAVTNFEDVLVRSILDAVGDDHRWRQVTEVAEGGAALLPEIERRLDELDAAIREASSSERSALQQEQADLLALRDEKRLESPVTSLKFLPEGRFSEDWAAADDDHTRRQILGDAVERIEVRRGRPGRRTEAGLLARFDIAYKTPPWTADQEAV